MDERAQFAIEASLSNRSFAEICRRFDISRPTGYKWLERYQAEGVLGMADQSRRPRACPHATPKPSWSESSSYDANSSSVPARSSGFCVMS